MIVPVFHLLKIHREMILGNPSVVVQDMLCKTPKSLYAIDVILAVIGKRFAVVEPMVLSQTLQRVVAPERVRVVDRSLSGMRSDVGHQFIGRDSFHDLRIDPSIAFQKAEYNAFPGSSPSALPLAPAAKVGLVNLNLAFELARLKLGHMVDGLAHTLVDAGNRLVIQAQISCHAIRGLLLVEAGKDGDLFAQLLQRFLFSTGLVAAAHIATPRPVHLERAAEYTLPASQKVGRTVENVLLSSNHKGILALDGYESN